MFMERAMKALIIICLMIFFPHITFGETYKWKDANGMHFTDNASSIPPKYREKVLEEARQNKPTLTPQVGTSLPHQNYGLPQGAKQENDYQFNTSDKPIPENRFIPQVVKTPPNFSQNQISAEKTLASALAPLAGFMLLWVIISLIFFIVWIVTLIDIIRSDFTDSSNKIMWLILVILVPFFGALLYMIIGVGQKKRRIGGGQCADGVLFSQLHPDKAKDGEFTM